MDRLDFDPLCGGIGGIAAVLTVRARLLCMGLFSMFLSGARAGSAIGA
jgi:hypothetical protein